MKKIIFLILLLSGSLAQAQAPKKFFTRFGGYGHDIGYGIVQTLNGQYAVTGSTSSFGNGNTDVYLALVDSMGWVRWQKSYGGFNNDIGKSIIQLKDSGFVIAGYTNSFGSGGYDMFLVRTDKTGNLIWQKTFGGFDWDFGYCVKEVNNGDSLIVCGSTYSYGYGKMDGFIVKTDINGNFMWQKVYGGPEDDEFKSFTLTYNNQYAFAGTTKSMGDVKGDCWFFKTALNGDSIMSLKYGNNRKQFINKIVQTTNNDFLLCGGFDVNDKDSSWSYYLNINENGLFNNEGAFTKNTFKEQQFTTVLNSKNNTFIYVEMGYNVPSGYKLEPSFCKFNGQAYVACNSYGSYEDEVLYDIALTRDKGYVVVGYTKGFNANLTDVFLVKMDTTLFGSTSMVGIEEQTKTPNVQIEVFPTISNSEIRINIYPHNEKTTLKIHNTIGALIHQSELRSNEEKIDISALANGFYYFTIESVSYSRSFKVIKTD